MQTNTITSKTEQKTQNQYGKNFWPMLMIFYALFFLRDVFSVNFPVTVYLVWVVVMAFAFNDTEIKGLLTSFIPFSPGFQSKYAILVCMIFLLIRHFKQLRIPFFTFIIPVLMLWEFLHLGDAHSTIAEYLSGFAPLMCLIIIASMPDKEDDASFFSRVLAVSLAAGSIILIASTVTTSDQSLLSLVQEGFRLGGIEEAEDYQVIYNANGLGYLCNIAIAGLLTNVYFKKAKKIDYILMVFLIVVGCLTISRTFLLCLAGTFVMYIILQEKPAVQKMKIFMSIVVILLIGIVILNILAPNIIENYIERFGAEDITGGRAYLSDFYNEFITASPERFWYGIGIQGIREKVLEMEGVVVNVPHNGYQELIVVWGVVGLILMLMFMLCMVLFARKKNPKATLMSYLPLVLLLASIVGGQFITSGIKLKSLVYIYLMIRYSRKESAKDQNIT